MLPWAVIAVLREVVRVGHTADHIHDIADSGPVLTVGRDIGVICLAENVGADIYAEVVKLLHRVHQKTLYGLRLGFVIGVVVVDVPVLFVLIRSVREADVVELDLVEAHALHCLLCQRDLVLPDIAAEGAGPVAVGNIQRLAVFVVDAVFRVIGHEEGVIEGGQTADDVEARVLELANGSLVFLEGIVGVFSGRRRILVIDAGGVADARSVDDVDDKGVDLRRFGVGDILVDFRYDLGVAGQIESVDMLGHDVVREAGLFGRIVVEAARIAAAVAVLAAGVGHVDAEAVVDLHRVLIGRGGIAAADVAGLSVRADVVEMHDAVCQIVVAEHGQLRALFDQRAKLDAVLRLTQILRRARVDLSLLDDGVLLRRQVFLGNVAVLRHVQIGQVIGDAAALEAVGRGVGDLPAAGNRAGLLQVGVVIGDLRRVGAEPCADIRLRGGRLLLLAGGLPASGQNEDQQDQRDQHQHRQQDQPCIQPQKFDKLLSALLFSLLGCGTSPPVCAAFHSNAPCSLVCGHYTSTFSGFLPFCRRL